MIALGIDQASTTGWTVGATNWNLDQWISGRFAAPKRPYPGERFLVVYEKIGELIEKYQPDVMACEAVYDPFRRLIAEARQDTFPKHTYSPSMLEFLHTLKGVVQMAGAKYSIPVEVYASQSWRATLKLPRKPEGAPDKWIKQQVIRWVRRVGGKIEGSDEADSFGICFHALHGKAAVARIPSLLDLASEG
jgi:Holliday junction resolvasome RuvABC endonuclease subunit